MRRSLQPLCQPELISGQVDHQCGNSDFPSTRDASASCSGSPPCDSASNIDPSPNRGKSLIPFIEMPLLGGQDRRRLEPRSRSNKGRGIKVLTYIRRGSKLGADTQEVRRTGGGQHGREVGRKRLVDAPRARGRPLPPITCRRRDSRSGHSTLTLNLLPR